MQLNFTRFIRCAICKHSPHFPVEFEHYSEAPKKKSQRILHRAVKLGIRPVAEACAILAPQGIPQVRCSPSSGNQPLWNALGDVGFGRKEEDLG